jgi:MFS family permease
MNLAAHKASLRRYTYYVAGSACYGWAPLFFLYMSERCTVSQVLLLEALYYISVVIMEVPSGYFSDRLGRKPTLMIAASALVLSYTTFALSTSWQGLACAQVLLAAGISFNSGTDTSFHLATLRALDKENEYGEREAKLGQIALFASASAALFGGVLGVFDMRLAYGLSAVGAIGALLAAWRFTEPREDEEHDKAQNVSGNISRALKLILTPQLRWLFGFASIATLINHIPYELYQPYIGQLDGALSWPGEQHHLPTLITGLHLMVVQVTASWFARRSMSWARRVGLRRFLLGSMGLQVGIIALMSQVIHPMIVVVLIARAWPGAAQRAPLRAHVTPHLPASVSATYLSIQSLSGRLGFATTLYVLSQISEAASTHGSELKGVLTASLMIAGICFGALLLTAASSRHQAPPRDI